MSTRPNPGCSISDAASSRLRWDRAPSTRLGLVLLASFLAFAVSAHAQGHGGGGPGGGGGGGGMHGPGGMGGGLNGGNFDHSPLSGNNRTYPNSPTYSTMSGGLQLGPSGRWWDNKDFARTIGIDSTQQRRLDEVFSGNRNALLKLYKNLQHEESQLGKTVRAKDLDETQIFAQIDRVTQARGELEKANAHLLLQLRKELTPDQTAKLDDHRPPSE